MSLPRTPPYRNKLRNPSTDENAITLKDLEPTEGDVFDDLSVQTKTISNINNGLDLIETPGVENRDICLLSKNILITELDNMKSLITKDKIVTKDLTNAIRGLFDIVRSLVEQLECPKKIISNDLNVSEIEDGNTTQTSSIPVLINKINEQNQTILKMQSTLDDQDRDRRLQNIIISDLPKLDNISDIDLVLRMANYLNTDITKDNVLYVNRLKNRSNSNRIQPLLVSFSSKLVRNTFFRAYMNDVQKFNLLDLGIGETKKRVFVNEHLCRKQFDIFHNAYKLKKKSRSQIKRVTTRHGCVFIQLACSENLKRIYNISDLQHFCASTGNEASSDATNE